LAAMTFDHYEIRIIKKEDAASYFQLIDSNRARFEDFIAGIVSKTNSLADTETFIAESVGENTCKTYLPYVVIRYAKPGACSLYRCKKYRLVHPQGRDRLFYR